ncbi:hypothetical protein ABFS82_04G061700 [Erythranthe guttata]|uniref:pentatricopeptide repeat-containing protein At3g62470, mitochondrial-like n=1 Tax=Erythranthe guttata TaxID=4155 RepID=UPI00064E00EF|nr:PREDICTED: pentatricopeptide repeat-containing protein At3g62470, mitochondrial-like [Erythranthe guttata]|eukprot:XP_012858814.1 PREDICTED: pentatricopeptide repeat-containing protein At3g62470, mitochondrial-like [Erythranthe guttata]
MAFHLRNSKKSPLSASTQVHNFLAGDGGRPSLVAAGLHSPFHGQDTPLRGRGVQGEQIDGSSLPVYFLLNSFTRSSINRTRCQIPFVLPYPSSLSPLQKCLPSVIPHQNPPLCLNKIRPFCSDVNSVHTDSEFDSDIENESASVDSAEFEADSKEVERVCKVIDEMFALDRNMEAVLDECGINLNHKLVLCVLQRFNHARKPAFRFFRWAGDRPGFSHNSTTYNAMMNILGKTRQFETLVSLLEEMGEKGLLTMETFTICIKVFAAAKERKKAVAIVDLMKKYNFKVGIETVNCLLDALGRAKLAKEAQTLFEKLEPKFAPNLKTYTILINGWCTVKNLMEAARMWNEMIDKGFKPDIVAHNIMLEGLLRSHKRSDAIKLFEVMKCKGPLPTVRSYSVLIKNLCKHGHLKEAIDYFDEMVDSGCGPDAAVYTCLMTGFANQKKMDVVYRLLSEMKEKNCQPDGRLYNALIKMMVNRRMPDEAVKIYKKMVQSGVEASVHTYNMIMKSYFVARDCEMGLAVWEEMKRRGFCPDENSYTVLVGGLVRQGRLNESCRYLEEMIDKGMRAPRIDYKKFSAGFYWSGGRNCLEDLAEKMKLSGNSEVANLLERWVK